MDNIKKLIEEAERDKSHDPHYIFGPEKLFALLEMISKKVCKDTLLDNSEDGELFEDGFEADWVDCWQQTLKSLKE